MEMEDSPPMLLEEENEFVQDEEQQDEEEEEEEWEDWVANDCQEEYVCLFCPSRFSFTSLLFDHCSSQHAFAFLQLRKDLDLDFYECIRLINFIRSQVASNMCWLCGLAVDSQDVLLEHIKSKDHAEIIQQSACVLKECLGDVGHKHDVLSRRPWQDDKYLTPFLENDPLLYSFEDNSDDDVTEQRVIPEDVKSLVDDTSMKSLLHAARTGVNDEGRLASGTGGVDALTLDDSHTTDLLVSVGQGNNHFYEVNAKNDSAMAEASQVVADKASAVAKKHSNKLKVSFAEVAARERFSINQSYFGSYSTFGIHREMLSDKIRTDAYEKAITKNLSLLKGAVVMDLGCGTGILSLFAAKAGAQRVIAVDGSKRMSLLAQQVAKANGFLNENTIEASRDKGAVINVVQGMIEELDLGNLVQSRGVDVLVSEWMGYCLLYESMLNSVLFARDRWLKVGGAILPDIAEMYVAGFGVGATSLPFWENVYGFDMKCIGREVLEEAASSLIVDAVESKDIVTGSCLLQTFDLTTMTHSDVDFTAAFELNPRASLLAETVSDSILCYGLVVWFDTQFSSRFCQEHPTVLSTSPYTPKTHWSQTLLTFQEPVCLAVSRTELKGTAKSGEVGSSALPASALKGRISIARSSRHRSIDVSLEMVAVGPSGVTQEWPVQMFDM